MHFHNNTRISYIKRQHNRENYNIMLSDIKSTVTITDRAVIEITGVREVPPPKSDESDISVVTNAGELTLKGEELSLSYIDTDSGRAEITGKLYSLSYSDDTIHVPDNFITRLFK